MAGLMANSARHAESGIEPERMAFRTAASARPITSTGTFERMLSNVSPTASTSLAVVTSDGNADGPSPVVRIKICSNAEKGLPDDIEAGTKVAGESGSGSAAGAVAASARRGSGSDSAMWVQAAAGFGAPVLNSATGGSPTSLAAASAFSASDSRSTSAFEAVDAVADAAG